MIRRIIASAAARYLRTHGAACAGRLLEQVAVGVRLSAAEARDVLSDAVEIHRRASRNERPDAMGWRVAIGHIVVGSPASDDAALRELATRAGVSPDEWLDTARQSATAGEAVSL